MKKTIVLALLASGTLGMVSAQASDVRVMAANCAYCHGPDGKSQGPIPSLAGLEKNYFVQQMKDFKSGARPATVMHQHAKGYSDEEMEKLADFFSAQTR